MRKSQAGLNVPAVVLGGPITGMVVARSLHRAGIPVLALGTEGDHFGRSRTCVKAMTAVGPDVQGQWMDWLTTQAPEGAVVLAASDEGLELLARNRATLVEHGLRPAEADDATVLALLDKERTNEIARSVGIATPRTLVVSSEADLGEALDDFVFPCGLKAVHRHIFERRSPIRDKVILVHDRAELDAMLRMMLDLELEMQVTEIVGGRDERIVVHTTYLDERGEPLMQFTHRKLRQRPIHFGVGCYVRGEDLPEVADAGLRFAQAAGVRGMAVTEFKLDPRDGQLKLFECNARFNLAVALLRASGFDLPLLSYRRALGEAGPAMGPARYGKHLWHPGPDFRSFLDYRALGETTTREWVSSLLHKQTFSLFATDDPWPSLVEQWATAERALKLGRRRLSRPQLTASRGEEEVKLLSAAVEVLPVPADHTVPAPAEIRTAAAA